MAGLTYRSPTEQDYLDVIAAVDSWWDHPDADGRKAERAALIPRLFFQHFTDTSLVVFDDDQLVAFLIGFYSQTHPVEAYIHFVGVAPGYRGRGLGADLYERFFTTIRLHGRSIVRAITSSTNTASQAFHRHMGFSVSDPIANYDGRGRMHVTFVRDLDRSI